MNDKQSGHKRYDEPVDQQVGFTPRTEPSTFGLGAIGGMQAESILLEQDFNTNRDFMQAMSFCDWVHDGQVRKYNGKQYSTHPRRCGTRAFNLLKSYDVGIAMLLHDGPEDQKERCPFSLIRALYDDRVTELVRSLTNPSKESPELNRSARKALDRKHYEKASLTTKICKAIDRIDNLGEMSVVDDPGFAMIYASESELLLEALRLGIPDDPKFSPLVYRAKIMFDELEQVIKTLRSKLKVGGHQ